MRALLLFVLLCFASFLQAQAPAQDPVSWTAVYKPTGEQSGEIHITANIEKGWHTYSQRPTDAGPISTTFSFVPSAQYALSGPAEESNVHEEFDKAFEARLFMFSEKAEFIQKIKLKSKSGFPITFSVEYVACNESMCLPPKTVRLLVKTP